MIKKVIYIASYIFIMCFLISCFEMAYMRGSTKGIKESKTRKVFIAEYDYSITDSIRDYYGLEFSELYLEKLWKYGRTYGKTIHDESLNNKYQLIFRYKEKELLDYYSRINIATNDSNMIEFIMSGPNCLYSSMFGAEFIADTLMFKIILIENRKEIGDLVLIKK